MFVAVNGASRFVLAKNRGELFSLVVSWELCYVFLVHFPLKQLGQFLFYISCCNKKKWQSFSHPFERKNIINHASL